MDHDRIVRPGEATKIDGLSDVHRRRLEKAGKFPKRFKLVADSGKYGAAGWWLSDILQYLEERAATVAAK